MQLFKRLPLGSDTEVMPALLIAVSVLGAGSSFLLAMLWRERQRQAGESGARVAQLELLSALQVTTTDSEADALLCRLLERGLPGAVASVLTGIEQVESCSAARIGREHERAEGRQPLLSCRHCNSIDAASMCIPLFAAGQVVGSVLVERPGGFDSREQDWLRSSVALAAPALAHLRALVAAETRAATDALTGLPNSRALRDALKRMVAHAGRSVSPVSVVLLDLDNFKRLNETYGHDRGDDALAAVGEMLVSSVRASDVAGRYGGEQFLVLLPDTGRDGALLLAEKLRRAVPQITVPGVERPMSASFGVASLPADGGDGDALVRLAGRALHAAKAAGRNRVEAAGLSVAPPSGGDQ